MSEIVDQLIALLGEGAVVRGGELDRVTSYWDSSPATAVALIRPKSTEELSRALALCYQHNHPVVTQGGMTNCVDAARAEKDEIILSLERMNQIETIDSVGGTATVQAGVILQSLQEACLEQDLLFPLDLGARGSCTIGGNVATNAGGINVLRYGMARALVLGMEVVLADGTVISNMNRMLKNNAAYDLKQLFIGSEGTLGVITRLVVRLFPKPLCKNSALVALQEFAQVVELLQTTQRELGGTLCAFEVMWGDHYRAVTGEQGHRPPMDRGFNYYIMMEAEGCDPDYDEQRFNQVLEACYEKGLIADAVIPQSESERRALWDVREDFDALLEPKPLFLYDISLPIVDMEAYIKEVSAALKQKWPASECYVLGHIADGNLHLFIRPNSADTNDLHYQSDKIVYGILKTYHGSLSAEHGIGKEKQQWLGHSRTAAELALMRTLKQTLDPKNLLNRGRVLGECS